MSYRATICYKKIKATEVYPFLINFKSEVINKFEEIASREYLYMPTVRQEFKYKYADEWDKEDANSEWAQNVFKYRWFYIAKYEILGMLNVNSCMYHLFDNVSYFQNSCDQDYEYEHWNGIPEFEAIADKWQNMNDEDVKSAYKDKYDEEYDADECSNLDYYRRSEAYDEIWSIFGEDYLYDESCVVYLSLFGHYELAKIYQFISLCKKRYQEWKDKIAGGADNER